MILGDLPYSTTPSVECNVKFPEEDVNPYAATLEERWERQIQLGATVYPLKRAVAGSFLLSEHGWRFVSDCFRTTLVGEGDTITDARDAFFANLHRTFQNLWRKRPFQMNKEDVKVWKLISDTIDVVAYEQGTPIRVKQLGTISTRHYDSVRHVGYYVRWDDGGYDFVDFTKSPCEFALMRPGNTLETVVERHRSTGEFQKMLYAKRYQRTLMTDQEVEEFWQSIPTASDKPKDLNKK